MAHVGFKKLTNEIEAKEGYGKERSKSIAASIGMKKEGKKAFEKKAAAGRRRAAKKKG